MATSSAVDRQVWAQAGLVLNDDDYVQAVAGAGLHEMPPGRIKGKPFLRWSPRNFRFVRREDGDHPSLEVLLKHRDRWKSELDKSVDKRVELEGAMFRSPDLDLTSIVHILNHVKVGAESVFVSKDAPHADVPWQWPLRIAALADDYEVLELDQLKNKWPSNTLAEVRPFGRDHRQCEVLVIRGDLRDGLRRMLNLGYPVRAGYIISISPADIRWPELARRVDVFLGEVRAAGASIISVGKSSNSCWEMLNGWVTELSHNEDIDIALTRAFPRDSSVHVLDPHLLKIAALTSVAKKLGRRLQQLPVAASLTVMQKTLDRLGWAKAVAPDHLGRRLETSAHTLLFKSESGAATALTEIGAAERTVRSEATAAQIPRLLQGDLFTSTPDGTLIPETRGLTVGVRYRLDVFIAPPGEGAIAATKVWDEAQLDWKKKDSYTLQVLFTEPRQWNEPLRGTLELRRRGSSTKCSFVFKPTESGTFAGRVTIYYRGRVLQTAVLNTTVAADASDWSTMQVEPLRFSVEAVLRRSLDTLEDRRRFDACIVLNHTSTGEHAATVASDEGAYIVSLDKVKPQLVSINALLSTVANQPKKYGKDLLSDANAELLCELAKEGNFLYRLLVRDNIDQFSAADAIRKSRHLQIVSFEPDALVPLEFVYSFSSPKAGAQVCKKAKETLEQRDKNGQTANLCPNACDNQPSPAEYVCPLGFWGLSKVIERHKSNPYLLRPALVRNDEPTKGRSLISIVGPSLLAASEQVSAASLSELKKKLAAKWKGELAEVTDWNEWPATVKKSRPTLLVILPHAEGTGNNIALEISGKTQQSVYITPAYVCGQDDMHPIVLLLGCDTTGTSSADAYTSNLSIFRQANAAIVLGTVATVFGNDVAEVAGTLIEILAEAVQNSSECFGEVLLQAKREAIASSKMVALCMVAFGDADWRLK
jgi:hypothetical protein